jgi:NADH-quinone oxidoreductase subunit E
LGEKLSKELSQILASHKTNSKSELIPILQEFQAEFGYLSREAMLEIAKFLQIPESTVYSVATFYNQFRLNPPGRHSIKICLGTACHLKGGELTAEAWEKQLNIKIGETTPDRMFSLERVACVGCCSLAPVTVVGKTVHGKITPTRVEGILAHLKLEDEKRK